MATLVQFATNARVGCAQLAKLAFSWARLWPLAAAVKIHARNATKRQKMDVKVVIRQANTFECISFVAGHYFPLWGAEFTISGSQSEAPIGVAQRSHNFCD